jgi:NADH-quinone oxidoreductase subunit G
MSAGPTVNLTIDGIAVQVAPGTNLVDAARQAGVEIPIFCHHPKLEAVGMCRMCLVDVGLPVVDRATGEVRRQEDGQPLIRFNPKLTAACTTPASDGMVIRTRTEAVTAARRATLEFLLSSHPLDCPVCDKGGECPLQNLTMRYGRGVSRFAWSEKQHFPKPVPLGPRILLDRERCVLCARCIRFVDEVADDPVLGLASRGRGMEVVSFSDPPFDSQFSGNTTDICPVGALTTVAFRFKARAWEVSPRPGVCAGCAVGCSVMYDTRDGQIARVMPRRNDAVNEIWLCDRGRFGSHEAGVTARLTTPLVRRGGDLVAATWEEALALAARGLETTRTTHGPGAIGGIAGADVPNEALYLFGRLLRAVLGTNNVDHRPSVVRDDTLLRLGAGVRADGAVEPIALTALGQGVTVLIAGLDVAAEAPVLLLNLIKAHRRGARLIVAGDRPQKLDHRAEAKVPLDAALGATAAELLAGARDTLIIYGQDALDAGLVPVLARLAALGGRAGEANNGLVAVGRAANCQGAADMGILPDWLPGYRAASDAAVRAALAAVWPGALPDAPGIDAGAMLGGGVRALYALGSDPVGDDPRCAGTLEALDVLVVQDCFLTATARRAHVVLPLQSPPECEGTFTSMTRRVQRFHAATRPVGLSRPGWAILRDLGRALGVDDTFAGAGDVWDEIDRAVPIYAGLPAERLGVAPASVPTDIHLPFAPWTDARAVSYHGTAYETDGGSGVVWRTGGDASVAPAADTVEV